MTETLAQNAAHLAVAVNRLTPRANDLQAIIDQVEKFYGRGWDTVLWEVGLIVAVAVGLPGFIFGVIAPLWINGRAERRLRKEIEETKELTAKARAAAEHEIKATIEMLTKHIHNKVFEEGEILSARIRKETQKAKFYASAVPFIFKASELRAQLTLQPADQSLISNIIVNNFYAFSYCTLADHPYDTTVARDGMDQFIPLLSNKAAQYILSQFSQLTSNLRAEVQKEVEPAKSAEFQQAVASARNAIQNIAYRAAE